VIDAVRTAGARRTPTPPTEPGDRTPTRRARTEMTPTGRAAPPRTAAAPPTTGTALSPPRPLRPPGRATAPSARPTAPARHGLRPLPATPRLRPPPRWR